MFIINNKDTIRRHWRLSAVFVVNFERISHLFLVFLLLTLKKYLLTGYRNRNRNIAYGNPKYFLLFGLVG